MKIRDDFFKFMKTNTGENKLNEKIKIDGGNEYSNKINETEKILDRNGINFNKNEVKGIEKFLNESVGTLEEKIDVIKIADSKNIDLTYENLRDMNEALKNEIKMEEVIDILGKEEIEGEEVKIAKKEVKLIENMKIPEELKEHIISKIKNGENIVKATLAVFEEHFGKEIKLDFSSLNLNKLDLNIDNFLKFASELFQKMLSGKFKLETVDGNILDVSISEAIEGELNVTQEELTDKELLENKKVIDKDKIISNKELINKEESKKEDKIIKKIINKIDLSTGAEDEDDSILLKKYLQEVLSDMDSFKENIIENTVDTEAYNKIFDLLNSSETVKLYLVEETTQKIIEIKTEFANYKNSILKKLENINSIENKVSINSAIDKLDDLIMKSEVTLFTDMKTEKKLLAFSSNLSEARKYLDNGDQKKAEVIIKNVKNGLEKLEFLPSKSKVQAFSIDKISNFSDSKDLLNKYNMNINSEISSRNALEIFRELGLNHEYEISEKVAEFNNLKKEIKLDINFKEILIKLAREESTDNKIVEMAEKTLNNLNGQQLLNKQGDKTSSETMFFNIPIPTEKEFKNMKLYVNSRDANNKLDWENCDLYFVIDIKNYGKTGIKIDVKNRNVNILVKNNNKELEKVISPLLEPLKAEFSDVGFKVNKLLFRPMDDNLKFGEKNISKLTYDKIEEKGFDFKI